MKPCIYSKKLNEKNGTGWHWDGDDISYSSNGFKFNTEDTVYYSLWFTYNFRFSEDQVSFAHFVPYDYSWLEKSIFEMSHNGALTSFLRINDLCHTLGGNPCWMITITENVSTYLTYSEE